MVTLLAVALLVLAIEESSRRSHTVQEPQALCESRSRDDFARAQLESTFAIYCPTFLPVGFRLERFHFGAEKFPPDATPPPEASSLYALYVNPTTGARLSFSQGNLGTDLFPDWRLNGAPPEQWTVAYGRDATSTLYADYIAPDRGRQPSVVWGHTEGGQQLIVGDGMGSQTLEEIANGMLRLEPANSRDTAPQ